MASGKRKKFTEGKILSSLVSLAGPIILANILQTAYQLIDTFWLGRLGANAVAAVSLSFPILFLILAIGGGLTLAGTVMVAQHHGAEDQEQVNYSSSQTVIVIFWVSLVLSVIGFFAARPMMTLVGAGPEILEDSVSYFKVSSIGFIFLFMFFVFQSLMRGIGNVMLPVYVILVTVFLNLVLDPLFIFGFGPIPGFGVAGAAVASVITQGLSAATGIYLLFRGKIGIRVKLSMMRFDFPWVKKMVYLGIPSSVEQSTRALAMVMMIILVTSFGSEVVAAYGIGARILSFVIIPALGFAIATTSLVGQNIGARKIKRAEKVGNLSANIAFFGLTFIGILLFIFAEPLTAFFVPNEPTVIRDGALFIKIMAPSFGLLGVQQILNGVFNGAGFTKASMFISILSLWVIRFPLAYVLAYKTPLGYEGIWWAFPASNLVAAIVAFVYFKMGYWKMRVFRYRHSNSV
ncbi:MATE family efflux transporter [Litoribacter ruber]|uniref:Multidrug-efflux transporter n=1 Tax=Litoribacter ruber TaxID=702568 RepID=A0AAP2CGG4_9BACT|nr:MULTISPECIES: MATE family efflux transporter [Litoribacter]MBS9523360.1 MATE family efflux transporter [Litoribacter alkaliphilus]MBT0812514.1 MATE family efflux transporter [Litoribacter ruber]